MSYIPPPISRSFMGLYPIRNRRGMNRLAAMRANQNMIRASRIRAVRRNASSRIIARAFRRHRKVVL